MSEKASKQQFMAGVTAGLTIVAAMAVVVVAVVGSGNEPEEDAAAEAESEGDGAPWIVQTRGVDASIRGLSVVSADVAWASGSAGTWLRTVNGGRVWNWGQVPGAAEMDFRDIEAFDADAACVLAIGRPAAIYCTEDGGRSWSLTYENDTPGIFFNCMDFADRQRGYAVGDPIDGRLQLIRTLDGGLSWHRLDPETPPIPNPGEGQFAASGACLQVRGDRLWIAGGAAGARVYSSHDGGAQLVGRGAPPTSGDQLTGQLLGGAVE